MNGSTATVSLVKTLSKTQIFTYSFMGAVFVAANSFNLYDYTIFIDNIEILQITETKIQ